MASHIDYEATNRKPKQTRSLSPVGTCDRQEHIFMLKLIPDIPSYRNMALAAATFGPGRYPSACKGLHDALEDLSTPRGVQGHDNA